MEEKQLPIVRFGKGQSAVLDPITLEAILDFKLSSMDLTILKAILGFNLSRLLAFPAEAKAEDVAVDFQPYGGATAAPGVVKKTYP